MRQKRFLSWIMAFTLLVGMFSFPAYAEGNAATTTISGDGAADKTGTMTITLVIPKKTPAATSTQPAQLYFTETAGRSRLPRPRRMHPPRPQRRAPPRTASR